MYWILSIPSSFRSAHMKWEYLLWSVLQNIPVSAGFSIVSTFKYLASALRSQRSSLCLSVVEGDCALQPEHQQPGHWRVQLAHLLALHETLTSPFLVVFILAWTVRTLAWLMFSVCSGFTLKIRDLLRKFYN